MLPDRGQDGCQAEGYHCGDADPDQEDGHEVETLVQSSATTHHDHEPRMRTHRGESRPKPARGYGEYGERDGGQDHPPGAGRHRTEPVAFVQHGDHQTARAPQHASSTDLQQPETWSASRGTPGHHAVSLSAREAPAFPSHVRTATQ